VTLCSWGTGLDAQESGSGAATADSSAAEGDRGLVGGPDQVDNQLALDLLGAGFLTEFGFLGGWNDWKAAVREKHGIGFGIDYSTSWLNGSNPLADQDGAGAAGMVRFFGSWELVGRGGDSAGALVWKVEHRHGYLGTTPVGLASGLGYVGLFEPPFSDQKFRTTNLYWRQRIAGRATVFVGFLDATDYVDVYALASPWTGFTNFAFSTGTQTIPVPNDAALGVAAGVMVSENLFAIGGLVDSNADPTRPFQGFESFFDQGELFKSIDLGWTPGADRIYLDNVHLTYWHQDERVQAGSPSGWGMNFSATTFLGSRWLPFLRAGYARDGGSLMQKSVAAGVGYQPVAGGHVIGLGASWGQPNTSTWGSTGLRDQFTFESFGRVMIARELALTPTLQLVLHPALNPEVNATVVFGVRTRIVL
jgi:porin